MEEQIEECYKKEAKDLINILFDEGFLANDLTRESIDWLEDYVGFILQCKCKMAAKTAILAKKVRELRAIKLT